MVLRRLEEQVRGALRGEKEEEAGCGGKERASEWPRVSWVEAIRSFEEM